MKVYVASSWRNQLQPSVVAALREVGFEVYDFKNPEPGNHGFHWSEIDPDWEAWDPDSFVDALGHPIARDGFLRDMDALEDCDICVLVLPCGRSAHLDLGFATGEKKHTVVLLTPGEPELMYLMCDYLATSLDDAVQHCVLFRDTPEMSKSWSRLTLVDLPDGSFDLNAEFHPPLKPDWQSNPQAVKVGSILVQKVAEMGAGDTPVAEVTR